MKEGLIYKAIADAMEDVGAIGKDKRNDQQRFNFRGIDDVYNKLHRVMAKHRIFTAPEVIQTQSQERQTKSGGTLIYRILTITYHFYTVDGSSVAVTVIGEGMDSGDKASNKAMSIAHKYALFQLFMIPTQEVVDPDAESPPPSKPASEPMSKQVSRKEKLAVEMKAAIEQISKIADPVLVDGYREDGKRMYLGGELDELAKLIAHIKAYKPEPEVY
jgi:hypothetical protein